MQPPSPTLYLAPAGSGKTAGVIALLRETLRAEPLAEAWVVLPDRRQAAAFRRRMAQEGGLFGGRVGTFADLYAEALGLAGRALPEAPAAVIQRLIRAALDRLIDSGAVRHYAPLQRRPGFARALADLFAELKRARVEPPQFAQAVNGRGPRLEELAALYGAYQDALVQLEWADPEGLGWLAVQALEADPTLASGWRLLAADGFDSFIPTQLEALRLLAGRVGRLALTLTGAPGMARPAHRRFARTLERVREALRPEIVVLPARDPEVPALPPALARLEAALFEPPAEPALDPGAAVTFVEAQSQAFEARAALRWIKARIVRDGVPPGECAVLAGDIGPYRPWLRQCAAEMGLPLRFTGGEPLGGNPAAAAALGVLELTLADWPWRALLDLVRSPYLDLSAFGLAPRQADVLAAAARWGRVVGGPEQWDEALADLAQQTGPPPEEEDDPEEAAPRPPQLPAGPAAEALRRALQDLRARLMPPESGSLAAWVDWLADLLAGDTGLGWARQIEAAAEAGLPTAARDRAALAAFQDVLRALALSEKIAGQAESLSFADFYAELRGAVLSAEYAPEPEAALAGRIYAANLRAARGVPYRAVALLGLAEGLLPAPLREDPFLTDDDRAALDLPLEPRLRSDEQTLFYEGATRAAEFLLLSRPYLADDGELWEASPYWHAARSLFTAEPLRARPHDPLPLAEAASRVELLQGLARAPELPDAYAALAPDWRQARRAGEVLRARLRRAPQGEHEGDAAGAAAALAAHFGPEHLWSASRLNTYGGCGYHFFAEGVLQLERREPPQPGLDVAQRGSLLHAALEAAYARALDPSDAESLLQALDDAAPDLFAEAPKEHGFRPSALWEVEREELLEMLRGTLRALAGRSQGWQVAALEARFGMDGAPPLELETGDGPLRLRGKIDRVDRGVDGRLRIIDYKSGDSNTDAAALSAGRNLQLPLYALAAERALGLGAVAEGFYWKISQAKPAALKLDRYTDASGATGVQAALEAAARHAAAHVAGIRAGRFAPRPPADGCPHYCPARAFCWRYQPRSR